MREAVICEPLRTPVGGFGGALRDVSATALASAVIVALLERTGLAPDAVDDVLLEIDRRCGSGLQAVLYAAMQVHHPVPGGMIETAENLRREYAIAREEQDEFAVRSHQRAAAAQAEGRFSDEIVPVTVKGRRGDTVVDRAEHIRPDSTAESLATLRPIMGRQDPDATVTAGNASGQNDGAAVSIVTSPAKADELGLRPLVRLVSWGVGGVAPKTMGIGPYLRWRRHSARQTWRSRTSI